MTPSRPPAPTVTIEGPLDADGAVAIVRDVVPRVLPVFLPDRRWFGEKDRRVAAVTVEDAAAVEIAGDWVVAVVARVDLDGGDDVAYFVPLSLVADPSADAPALATVRTADGTRFLVDAFSTAAFPRWFLARLGAGQPLLGERGCFVWEPLPGLDTLLVSAQAASPELGSAEQSNTSVRFGASLFLKVFRRLRSGVNPDQEIGVYLATRTGFRRLPLPLGTAAYLDAAGVVYPLALAQSFVANAGDGWSLVLNRLPAAAAELPRPLRALGERTAQLHLALGRETDDPAFSPEVVSEDDAERWASLVRQRLDAVASELRRGASGLDPPLGALVEVLHDRLPELGQRANGFVREIGARKIRVHGDYHLGQVLRTPDADWTILDFEGEPARPTAERRVKTSPLKDVAGMLRSFGYARSAALRAAGDDASAEATLRAWGADARDAFLAGYRDTIAQEGQRLVPDDPEDFRAALGAWELDKAVYELRYELSNRPDWIRHALGTLVGEPSPAGEAT